MLYVEYGFATFFEDASRTRQAHLDTIQAGTTYQAARCSLILEDPGRWASSGSGPLRGRKTVLERDIVHAGLTDPMLIYISS